MYHDEDIPLDDTIIHPSNAEAKIWAIQDIHKRTASHLHLAKLWRSDLRHHAFVDPKLQTLSKYQTTCLCSFLLPWRLKAK